VRGVIVCGCRLCVGGVVCEVVRGKGMCVGRGCAWKEVVRGRVVCGRLCVGDCVGGGRVWEGVYVEFVRGKGRVWEEVVSV